MVGEREVRSLVWGGKFREPRHASWKSGFNGAARRGPPDASPLSSHLYGFFNDKRRRTKLLVNFRRGPPQKKVCCSCPPLTPVPLSFGRDTCPSSLWAAAWCRDRAPDRPPHRCTLAGSTFWGRSWRGWTPASSLALLPPTPSWWGGKRAKVTNNKRASA